MTVLEDIEESLNCGINCSDGAVFIVKYHDIYDNDGIEFIIGVGSTRDYAIQIIKSHIQHIDLSYSCCRFSIERWYLNECNWTGTTEQFTKEQNIEWAKELGVYYD